MSPDQEPRLFSGAPDGLGSTRNSGNHPCGPSAQPWLSQGQICLEGKNVFSTVAISTCLSGYQQMFTILVSTWEMVTAECAKLLKRSGLSKGAKGTCCLGGWRGGCPWNVAVTKAFGSDPGTLFYLSLLTTLHAMVKHWLI